MYRVELTRHTGEDISSGTIEIDIDTGDIYKDVALWLGWNENAKKPMDPLWWLSTKGFKTIRRITDEENKKTD